VTTRRKRLEAIPNERLAGWKRTLEAVRVMLAMRHSTRITKRLAERVVDSLFEVLWADLRSKGRAVVPGFGVFLIRTRKARRIAQPPGVALDGSLKLPKTWTLAFRASKHRKGVGDGPR